MRDKANEDIQTFNKLEDKTIINKLFITENTLIGNKNNDNYCYQNIIYANKKYNIPYTNRQALKYENINYYCKNHHTTRQSNEITENNKKKRITLKSKYIDPLILFDNIFKKN